MCGLYNVCIIENRLQERGLLGVNEWPMVGGAGGARTRPTPRPSISLVTILYYSIRLNITTSASDATARVLWKDVIQKV